MSCSAEFLEVYSCSLCRYCYECSVLQVLCNCTGVLVVAAVQSWGSLVVWLVIFGQWCACDGRLNNNSLLEPSMFSCLRQQYLGLLAVPLVVNLVLLAQDCPPKSVVWCILNGCHCTNLFSLVYKSFATSWDVVSVLIVAF